MLGEIKYDMSEHIQLDDESLFGHLTDQKQTTVRIGFKSKKYGVIKVDFTMKVT